MRMIRWVFVAWLTYIPAALVLRAAGWSDAGIVLGSAGTGAVTAFAVDLFLARRTRRRARLRQAALDSAARNN